MTEHGDGTNGQSEPASSILLCPQCDDFLGASATSSFSCPTCGDTYCPYCLRSVVDRCEHLFAAGHTSDLDPWYRSPFEDLRFPHLAREPAPGQDWSEAQFVEAFGDLLPALEAYDEHDGLAAPPRQDILFDALVERLTVPLYADIRLDTAETEPDEELESEFSFFSEQPDEARAQLRALVDRLADGFRRLEAMPPAARYDSSPDGTAS